MKILTWTPELANSFWSDLANSDFLANISFSKFAAPLLVDLAEEHISKDDSILDFGAGAHLYLVEEALKSASMNLTPLQASAVLSWGRINNSWDVCQILTIRTLTASLLPK
jgi:hypothetical protein